MRQLLGCPVDDVGMGTTVLDHERLDVYQLSLDFTAFGNGVIEGLPRGRSHLADQLTRASLSIVLNIAVSGATT
jgi:hypothetical protein